MYRPTIGLEVHAELYTRTKMFCDSANNPDETEPNKNVCPVCMAHPGTLPVINREAVRQVLRIGSAVGGRLADFSEFDRKSYFYPDIPKGYQISQYKYPLVAGGSLAGVALTRVHLEEDTARSIHLSTSLEAGGEGKSLIDFNRAGIPLMELVTEPVIPDAETAGRFARELQLLLRTLGASEANLEKGEMRLEANISVSSDTRFDLKSESSRSNLVSSLGTKVEIKNLNSFRSVEAAIAYEIKRQTELLEAGGAVVQETRGWDEAKQETFHQRFKESSADYRYFPEPDLPKLFLSEIPDFAPDAIRASLPELPWERRMRYEHESITAEYVEMFLSNEGFGTLFEETLSRLPTESTLIASYIGSDIAGLVAKSSQEGLKNITPEGLALVLGQYVAGTLSSRGVKETISELFLNGGDAGVIAQKYAQQSDESELEKVVESVLKANEKAVAEYTSGKEAALQFLLGQAMRESKGAGNPIVLKELIQKKLG